MENKDIRYTVRITESEKKILEIGALKENIKLSDYVRNKLFNKTIAIAPKENNDINAALEKIKDKYIVEKYRLMKDKKDIFGSTKMNDKINIINEIIKEIDNM